MNKQWKQKGGKVMHEDAQDLPFQQPSQNK